MNAKKWKVGKHSRLRLITKLAEEVGEAAQEVGNFYDVTENEKGRNPEFVKQLQRRRLENLHAELEHVELLASVLRRQTAKELREGVWQ